VSDIIDARCNHDDQWTLFIISRSVLLRIGNISEKNCREIKTYFVPSNYFFRKSCLNQIMWKNVVERSRPEMKIWCMRIAHRIPKAKSKGKVVP
jgi:hypothetical protein